MSQRYYIVYPKGDKTKLTVHQFFSYEEDDYSLASRQTWDTESDDGFQDAWEHCQSLARKHDLELYDIPNFIVKEHDYLD